VRLEQTRTKSFRFASLKAMWDRTGETKCMSDSKKQQKKGRDSIKQRSLHVLPPNTTAQYTTVPSDVAVPLRKLSRSSRSPRCSRAPASIRDLCFAGKARRKSYSRETSQGISRLDHLRTRWHEITPTDGVRDQAERLLALHRHRAGDALQLAAALDWCSDHPREHIHSRRRRPARRGRHRRIYLRSARMIGLVLVTETTPRTI
jgi:hypothetical protein